MQLRKFTAADVSTHNPDPSIVLRPEDIIISDVKLGAPSNECIAMQQHACVREAAVCLIPLTFRLTGYGMGSDDPLSRALFWHPRGGGRSQEWWGHLPSDRVSHLLPHTFEVRMYCARVPRAPDRACHEPARHSVSPALPCSATHKRRNAYCEYTHGILRRSTIHDPQRSCAPLPLHFGRLLHLRCEARSLWSHEQQTPPNPTTLHSPCASRATGCARDRPSPEP